MTSLIDQAFPGNQGITQGFNPPVENGIDIGFPAGAPVRLPGAARFVGQAAGGYVDIFQSAASGLYEYFQHIVSAPLARGSNYAAGTQIGTVAPVSDTPAGYSTTGPHLEFGIANAPPAGAAAYSLAFPSYANIDPTAALSQDVGNMTSQSKSAGAAGNWWDGITGIPADIGTAAGHVVGSVTGAAGNAATAAGQAAGQTVLNGLGSAASGLLANAGLGAFLRKWGVIIILSVGVLLLVLELFHVSVGGSGGGGGESAGVSSEAELAAA